MIKKGLLVWFVFMHQLVMGQIPVVPDKIYFADMELRLTDKARKTIQADVDAIYRNPKYFDVKVERADLYFPIVERIFKEEGFPDDFKYLAIQESSLIPDAVSSSKAVGYWQFKKESAIEVGLRVDHDIDERMNIVSATRGAVRYLKRNNATLDNWIYALLSYNLGLGGVQPHVEKKYVGSKKMEINNDMHWYVLRFLAHKIAYQDKIGKNSNRAYKFTEYTRCHHKSLDEIAEETKVAKEDVLNYNKWVLCKRIPNDKPYVVLLYTKADQQIAMASDSEPEAERKGGVLKIFKKKQEPAPEVPVGEIPILSKINGLKVIKAKEGDSFAKLAYQGKITTSQLLAYNDLKSFDKVKPGKFYYLEPKKSKAIVMFHTVKPGETLKDISDQYGIRVNDIKKKNRMKVSENALKPGRVLWLKKKRPKDTPIEFKPIPVEKTPEVTQPPVSVPEVKEVKPEIKPEAKVEVKIETKPEVKEEVRQEVRPEPVQEPKTEVVNTEEESIFMDNYIKPALEKNYQIHVVEAGQTLYGISRLYSTTVDSLRYYNDLQGDIKPGNQLIIREITSARKGISNEVKSTPSRNIVIHKVEKGETLYSISRKYAVSVKDIQEWNNKTDFAVSIGEELKILKDK